MTATVDFRRSDHEREVAPAARGRDESLCLSELMDEILENDAGILDQANDFMHLLPGVDDMGNMASFHLDPFSVFEEEDIEPVFASLGDDSSQTREDLVDIESVDSLEEPTAASGCVSNPGNENEYFEVRSGCARTMGVLPHHYGKMKLRLRDDAEVATLKRKKRNRIVSDDESSRLKHSVLMEPEGASFLQLSPVQSGNSTITELPAFLSSGAHSTDEKQAKKSSRKSLHKRNRTRRILDTPPSSPIKWQGAHAATSLLDISPQLGKTPVKMYPSCADSAASNNSQFTNIGSPKSVDRNNTSKTNNISSSDNKNKNDNNTKSNNNNENSNSISCSNRDGGKKKKSHSIPPALSDSNTNSSLTCTKVSSLSPTESAPKLRLDGLLVSPYRETTSKQKVVPRSLVEKLKAAAQKASARQSILLQVPTSKAAEISLVALDHDYCFQKKAAQADQDNLEPEPMDVESDEEQSPVRIEVLPDLSLAKRQRRDETQSMAVDGSLEQEQEQPCKQEPAEVALQQPTPRSLLKVNQHMPTAVQMVTLQQSDQTPGEVMIPAQSEDGSMVLASNQGIWTIDDGMAFVSHGVNHNEQLVNFVKEEEVMATALSEGGSSDSSVESLYRERKSHEGNETALVNEIIEDDHEGPQWNDEKARGLNKSLRRDPNNNRNGNSGSDACSYRRRRRRSGSATSNSSFTSSDSARSRSRSIEDCCGCSGSAGNSRQRGDQSYRKRSLSRDGCRRCRCPSPDYTVGSHAHRQRSLEVNEREAYATAVWENRNTNTQRPPLQPKRERKNIWCMDAPRQSAEPSAPYQKRSQTLTAMQEALEKIRKGGDRKIIYVGKIPEGTTRVQVREWFSRFGKIAEVSLHFRDAGENYGFVTFERAKDAYQAVERGNDDPELPKFQLCFGGRRQFCGQQWSDLDSQPEKDYLRDAKGELVLPTYQFTLG
ncbi:uncharacterized protein LOC111261790 isoform X3 [Varroa jacobsoni]|uniref:uncharacterized protein LOC111261790 isoform X3 n=1 Tax=Varroa jacobsoni TaxID=62625 RepID=UPI000BF4AA84|nr:uncharacterized protein LOC111261790 isoform X3 [Varroa jacobsoni]